MAFHSRPAGHGVKESIGQGDKDQIGGPRRAAPEGKAEGRDDQTEIRGRTGIQDTHADGFAKQAALLADASCRRWPCCRCPGSG